MSGRTIIRRPDCVLSSTQPLGPPQPRPEACNSPRRAATVELNLWTRRLKPLNAALEAIRDVAVNALTQIDQSQETRGLA
jgi:hypothetical protein